MGRSRSRSPEKRLLEREPLIRRIARFWKKKTRLPFSPYREKTIGKIKYRDITDIKFATADDSLTFRCQFNFLGRDLPSGDSGFTEARSKAPIVDMVCLPSELLETSSCQSEVTAFYVDLSVPDNGCLLREIQLETLCLQFPLRCIY